MLNTLLANAVDKTRAVSIGESAILALLGYLVVFLGIAFLIFIVWLVGKAMVKASAKTEKKVEKPVASVAKKVEEENSEEITDETVAVITAAIMAYYQQNNPKCEFTVKRIKRI